MQTTPLTVSPEAAIVRRNLKAYFLSEATMLTEPFVRVRVRVRRVFPSEFSAPRPGWITGVLSSSSLSQCFL